MSHPQPRPGDPAITPTTIAEHGLTDDEYARVLDVLGREPTWTELGVFISEDAGATWAPSGAGMPNVIVETLDFQDDNTLVAFTYGRGVYVTALAACCPGDLNGDGVVDTADLGVLLGVFGTTDAAADLNGDGVVDTADLGVLLGAFGTSCG